MTDAQEKEFPLGMQRVELPVKRGKLIIQGRFLAGEDNDTEGRTRWAELVAYKGFGVNPENEATFGREYYLLYAIGHSLVVHSLDGCKGTLAPVSSFKELNEDWDLLEPCPECNPDYDEDTPPDAQFKLEVTRYSHTEYLDAEDLIDALRKCDTCGHRPHKDRACGCHCTTYIKGELSQIGARLLEKVRLQDESVDDALPAEIHLL